MPDNPFKGKPVKPMPDAELAQRKRRQAVYSKTGSTLGLSALGAKGAAIAARSNPRTRRFVKPLDEIAVTAGIGGAGIGGIGGYNFAAYTREDARRDQARKRQKVSKAMTGESAFGVVHKRGETEVSFKLKKIPKNKRRKQRIVNTAAGTAIGAGTGGILGAAINPSMPGKGALINSGIGAGLGAATGALVEVPSHEVKRVKFDVRKAYDPEEKRHQRAGMATGAGAAAAAGLGYAATSTGVKAAKQKGKADRMTAAALKANKPAQMNQAQRDKVTAALKTGNKLRLKAIKGGGKAAVLGAGAAAAGTGAAVAYKRNNTRGRTYRAWYDE